MKVMRTRRVRSAPKPPDYINCSQAECQRKSEKIAVLRRALSTIKVRSYELGCMELHDMALAALGGKEDEV
jgi:hypothetical protein